MNLHVIGKTLHSITKSTENDKTSIQSFKTENNNGICVFDHWALIWEQLLRYKCNEERCYEVLYAQWGVRQKKKKEKKNRKWVRERERTRKGQITWTLHDMHRMPEHTISMQEMWFSATTPAAATWRAWQRSHAARIMLKIYTYKSQIQQ